MEGEKNGTSGKGWCEKRGGGKRRRMTASVKLFIPIAGSGFSEIGLHRKHFGSGSLCFVRDE